MFHQGQIQLDFLHKGFQIISFFSGVRICALMGLTSHHTFTWQLWLLLGVSRVNFTLHFSVSLLIGSIPSRVTAWGQATPQVCHPLGWSVRCSKVCRSQSQPWECSTWPVPVALLDTCLQLGFSCFRATEQRTREFSEMRICLVPGSPCVHISHHGPSDKLFWSPGQELNRFPQSREPCRFMCHTIQENKFSHILLSS